MELIDKKAALKALYLAGEAIKEYSGRFYEGKFNGYQCAYELINDMPAEKERDKGQRKKKPKNMLINIKRINSLNVLLIGYLKLFPQ